MPMIHIHFIRVRIVLGGSLSFRSELSFVTTPEIPYQGAQSSCEWIRVHKKLLRTPLKKLPWPVVALFDKMSCI